MKRGKTIFDITKRGWKWWIEIRTTKTKKIRITRTRIISRIIRKISRTIRIRKISRVSRAKTKDKQNPLSTVWLARGIFVLIFMRCLHKAVKRLFFILRSFVGVKADSEALVGLDIYLLNRKALAVSALNRIFGHFISKKLLFHTNLLRIKVLSFE